MTKWSWMLSYIGGIKISSLQFSMSVRGIIEKINAVQQTLFSNSAVNLRNFLSYPVFWFKWNIEEGERKEQERNGTGKILQSFIACEKCNYAASISLQIFHPRTIAFFMQTRFDVDVSHTANSLLSCAFALPREDFFCKGSNYSFGQ